MEEKKNSVIRVAQVVGVAGAGGVEAVVMNYYKHIDTSKVQFDVLAESDSAIVDKKLIESLGGRLVIIPSYKNPFKYVKALTKIFKEGHYDIVHSNMNTLSYFTLKAAKRAGVEVRIAHSHSTSNPKEFVRNVAKNMLRPLSKRYATDYFACSEKAGRYLFGDKTFDTGKVVVVNNAIDLERFKFSFEKRNAIREELKINDKFVIGHIGRMVTQKNQMFLLDIFAEIVKKKDNAVLMILGDGPLREELKNKAEGLGVADKVLFLGIHPNTEDYYAAMDCTLFPSLYEGFPITVLEAQVEGLPSFISDVVTKESSVTDLVRRLSLSQSPSEWADEVLKYAELTYDRESYYWQLKSSKYDIKKETERLVEKYERLVNKKAV